MNPKVNSSEIFKTERIQDCDGESKVKTCNVLILENLRKRTIEPSVYQTSFCKDITSLLSFKIRRSPPLVPSCHQRNQGSLHNFFETLPSFKNVDTRLMVYRPKKEDVIYLLVRVTLFPLIFKRVSGEDPLFE